MFAVRRATFLAGISFLVRSSQANVEKTEFGGQGEVVLCNAPYLSIYLQSINNITSAWAVDREFVNIDWASLGPNFTQLGSNLIQIESNSDHIGSHWPLLGQKWSLAILESKL